MISRYRKLRDKDRGIAMAWLAIMLVLLMGASGFAVDLGWLYLSTSRAQRSADSAAMAGVVNLPGFVAQADLEARDAGRANRYDICDPGFSGCADSMVTTPLADNELHVELSTTVNSIFLSVMGFDQFDITREATAKYVKPVPLGSPNRCFGQDPTGTFCPADPFDPWAAANGPYTHKQDGDPYGTHCVVNSGQSSCSSSNSMYAHSGNYVGYYYAVDVTDGSQDITVNVYDAAFMDRPNYPNVETADEWYSPDPNAGITTNYSLHSVDSTPHDPTDNIAIPGCSWSLGPDSSDDPGDFINEWQTLCTLNAPVTPGLYILHVWTSGVGSGTSNYSLAADSAGGTDPRIYGINDMSIFSNKLSPGNPSQLYLVEIDPVHAGSKLELQFFDAGDASGLSYMRVRDPFGNMPACDYTVSNHDFSSTLGSGSKAQCEFLTTTAGGTRLYNNEWVTVLIDLPSSYTCNAGDCFWYMELELSQPNERTTWRARVLGNPVKLVP